MNGGELIAVIEPDGSYALDWQYWGRDGAAEYGLEQEKLYEVYREDRDQALFRLGAQPKTGGWSESLVFLYQVAAAFVSELSRNPDLETLREKATAVLEPDTAARLLAGAPFLTGAQYLDREWLERVWQRLGRVYAVAISQHPGSVSDYFLALNPDFHLAGKIYFHLVESQQEEFPFAFLATYAAEPSATGKAKHLPLKNALQVYGQNSRKLLELLSTVYKAARQSTLVAELVETGEIFYNIGFTSNDAYLFLKEAPLYEAAGILCRLPNWWRKKGASVQLKVRIGAKEPSRVGMDALLDFDVQLSLGEETLTVEEMRQLLAEAEGLAYIKGKWIEVDREKLKETLEAYETAHRLALQGGITLMEAMRLQLGTAQTLALNTEHCEVEVTNGEWLEHVLAGLTRVETIAPVSCGPDFKAVLREYQKRGLGWLAMMKQLGLGACLADDMGLGKTVQVIALLNHGRINGPEKTLLVVPASLIGNWTTELSRFAPGLPYYVVHPQENRNLTNHQTMGPGVYITTYGMLLRLEWLRDREWDLLILDEAQAIKNPGTKQTKAVKQLKARTRIAMTGTPVENRLADLWSIFDFLNQGLLGSAKEFSRFAKQMATSAEGYSGLKQLAAPFILRRLKTDRTIIADLPEKIEMKTYATLTKKQAALYSATVAELQSRLGAAEGIERKGVVLGALTKFKQICNHPDQYLGQTDYAETESGKYARLREICETIYEKRERVLVFTQFKEITGPLAAFLATVFQREGLVLHGETPVTKRKDLVDRFQSREYVPFMVLSIKAGGVGLNLTAANHVIHFDRWWNPAVENQATDRAFQVNKELGLGDSGVVN